ncbi:hypothetical protein [Candidatus Cloacimonas acidaminovorans]|jgi:hypothetical protein|uniref:hypothetical protein n=1 Tax=Candidatus Cloacimonas acidaminovorans TaxID=456827 RepID=UPI0002F14CC8|nr:hypothetical protein [Candidatus Cloacimonas acidaminovorans]
MKREKRIEKSRFRTRVYHSFEAKSAEGNHSFESKSAEGNRKREKGLKDIDNNETRKKD